MSSGHNFAYSKTRDQDLALMLAAEVLIHLFLFKSRPTSELRTALP